MVPANIWKTDPAFGALDFHLDEAGYYQYQWQYVLPTEGIATATADFDCDGLPSQTIYQADIIEGNISDFIVTDISDE